MTPAPCAQRPLHEGDPLVTMGLYVAIKTTLPNQRKARSVTQANNASVTHVPPVQMTLSSADVVYKSLFRQQEELHAEVLVQVRGRCAAVVPIRPPVRV
jgi:hypothetical protein